jgi:uncharacterized protein (TIGR02186 family)
MKTVARIAITLLALIGACGPVSAAERLVASLSSHQVFINSSFSGTDIVLFGSVERDGTTPQRRGGYDLVVTVTGPREAVVTRRKGRVFGIWVNVESHTFVNVPSYLAVLSTKPLAEIANADTLRRLEIGLRRTFLPLQVNPNVDDVGRDAPFRLALLELRERSKLFVEQASGVTFLTPTLFRTTIPLPDEVSVGNYEVDLKLFAGGELIARGNSAFEVVKVGFEQFVAHSAHNHGVLYGLATVLIALMAGWFASVVFRKD